MKRIIALFLAVVLLLSLVGCATTTTGTAPAAKESDAAPTVETESSKQNNSGEATTIKIALYAPITGNNAQYGLAIRKRSKHFAKKSMRMVALTVEMLLWMSMMIRPIKKKR